MKALLKNNIVIIEMILLIIIIGMIIYILKEVVIIEPELQVLKLSLQNKRLLAIVDFSIIGTFNINQICG